jgi:hypothetical protein
LTHYSDVLRVDGHEVESLHASNCHSLQGKSAHVDEAIPFHGVLQGKFGKGASRKDSDIHCVESLKGGSLDSYKGFLRLPDRWPSAGALAIDLELGIGYGRAAEEDLSWSIGYGLDEIGGVGELCSEYTLALIVISKVHINGVPGEMGDLDAAGSILQRISGITLQTGWSGSLSFATFGISHADASRHVEIRSTLGAVSIGIDGTLWVSELALSIGIEEVDAVTGHTGARGVKLPAVSIGILASSILIETIPLDTGLTLGLFDVVVETVGVLRHAELTLT